MEQPVATGVEPLDQRRVSVVCRTTRVDVSLPAHLELVAVIPEVVELVRDHIRAVAGPGAVVDVDARMGGAAGGSWQLSKLAGGPLSVSETLSQQRVHDGEILVLDHRPVPTPAPLFDDVLQGLTDPRVQTYGSWGRRETGAAVLATVLACAVASALASVVQWATSGGYLPAVGAAVLAMVSATAVLVTRSRPGAGDPTSGRDVPDGSEAALWVAAASTVLFATLTGLFCVPGSGGTGSVQAGTVLAGATTGAVTAVVLRALLVGGRSPAIAQARGVSALLLGCAVASGIAALCALGAASTDLGATGVAPAAVVLGLLVVTAAPRVSVSASRVPLPPVPVPGDDDPEVLDSALPSADALRQSAARARSWLSGLLGGGATATVAGVLVALDGDPSSTRWAVPMAVAVVPVLVLRGLAYADRSHAATLLGAAVLLVTGVLAGAAWTLADPVTTVVPAALVLAAAAVVIGVVVPRSDPSPVVRHAVGVLEVALLGAVVPLAFGAMGLYSAIRHR